MKNNYWQDRQEQRLDEAEKIGNQSISKTMAAYEDSLERVKKQIDDIYRNYAKDLKMDKDELKKVLSENERNGVLKEIRDNFYQTGTNTKENDKWLRSNYLSRLDRQKALKLQLESESRILREQEKLITTEGYKKVVENTSKSLSKDMGSKTKLSKSAKASMLNNKWVADKNYSQRIWKNTDGLKDTIETKLNSAMLTGASKQQVINELMQTYEVKQHEAARLIRTESNYFANQSELETYKKLGITQYKYFAVRDRRTSSICALMDNSVYEVSKAQAGINYPPMHPNCRSTTMPVMEGIEDIEMSYRNPFTNEYERSNKSYDEYTNEVESNELKRYNEDVEKVRPVDIDDFAERHKMSFDKIIEKATDPEYNVATEYSGDGYRRINGCARGMQVYQNEENVNDIQLLDSLLNKFELKEDIIAYRGVDGKTPTELGIKGLGESTLKGFTSTSIDKDVADDFADFSEVKTRIEILAPKGTNCLFMEELTVVPNEYELLFPNNTKFDIVSIEKRGDVYYVKARVKQQRDKRRKTK